MLASAVYSLYTYFELVVM